MSKIKIAAALLGGLLISTYGGGAQANVVYSDFNGSNGVNSAVIDNFNVTTSPGGVFEQKTNGGSFGVGVSDRSSHWRDRWCRRFRGIYPVRVRSVAAAS